MTKSDAAPFLPLYAALLTGVLGFVGSWIGAQIAFLRFKQERAFDQRLDWYERAIRSMNRLGEAIQIADTFQNEGSTRSERLAKIWRGVQSAHLEFSRVAQEAGLFGSPAAVTQISSIDKIVQNTANESEAFDPPKIDANKREKILSNVYELPEKLEKACKALTTEARRHLGLDSKSVVRRYFNRE